MKIVDKINELHNFMLTPAGGITGARIQQEAHSAIQEGIKSPEWKAYMSNFASNPEQLQRLIGEDNTFTTATLLGPYVLSYMVANGVCGVATTLETTANLPTFVIDSIDDKLNPATAPIPDSPAIDPNLENMKRFVFIKKDPLKPENKPAIQPVGSAKTKRR